MYRLRRGTARNNYSTTVSSAVTRPSGSIKVQCDWFRKTNTANHRTDEYDNDALVLRRGQTFFVGMTFEGINFFEIMKTVLGFSVATSSQNVEYMQILCSILDRIDKSKWCMEVVEKYPSLLHVVFKVNIPPNAIVGRYSVDVIVPTSKSIKRSEIIVLFNPWCPDDEVYLHHEEQRIEYVLNDTGTIYQGNSHSGPSGIRHKKWNYGQFERGVLACVLFLLESDKRSQRNPLKALTKRSSSLWNARILSAMINSTDDQGVLEGKWSGNYSRGKSPLKWNGSVAILQQYLETKRPVRYGQCWVFAGVLTTALRALGIPARTVTNYDSGHDTDQSMTIDEFYDEEGNKLTNLNVDSVWNFHVWNELWSKRRDLPGNKYDGWQVVDATPQETSQGIYQLGPAPVNAIKEGEIYVGFDTGFVFAEVNADYVTWVVRRDRDGKVLFQKPDSRYSRHIGKFISTKKVGIDEREDITHLYKHNEGTLKERKAFDTAFSFGAGADNWAGNFNVEKEGKDLTLDLTAEPRGIIQNGKNFTGTTVVNNTSRRRLTVNVKSVLNSIMYTGETKHLIKSQKFENISVGAGESVRLEMQVSVREYIHKLADLNALRLVSVAKVLETNKMYVDTFDFQLENRGRITVEGPCHVASKCLRCWSFFRRNPREKYYDISRGDLKAGHKSEVRVSFHNNLPITLNNLVFTIEGAGLTPPVQRFHDKLAIDKTATKTFFITPYKSGVRTLIVDVDSDEIKDFKSFVNVNVEL